MIINTLNSEILTMCAVCISETSGGQNALLIIVLSFILLGLLNSSWKKYFKEGNGALVGIEVKGGVGSGKKFIESLKMFYHVANIGDARSLAIHPATTTHSQLTEEELLAAGVTSGYVRLSIGIEHPDDIIADLDQALNESGKTN